MRRSIAHNASGILRNMEPYKIPEDKQRYIKDAKKVILAHKFVKYFSLSVLILSSVLYIFMVSFIEHFFEIRVTSHHINIFIFAWAMVPLQFIAIKTTRDFMNDTIARVAGQYSVTM